MKRIIEKNIVYNFINKYFNFLKVKIFLYFEINCILGYISGLVHPSIGDFFGFSLLIILFLILVPSMLKGENKQGIEKFYSENNENHCISIVCNLKKFLGPVIGVLYISKKEIKFIPFKENLQNESILIEERDMKNIRISYYKGMFYNNLFFGELFEYIKISYEGKSILFQGPKVKFCVEKANEEHRN